MRKMYRLSFQISAVLIVICSVWVISIKSANLTCYDAIRALPVLGSLIDYAWRPADFFIPCFESEIFRGERTFDCTFKYYGRYEVCIVGIDSNALRECDLCMGMTIRDAENVLFSGQSSRAKVYDTWDGTDHSYRYTYFTLGVPNMAPLGKRVKVTIECLDDAVESFKHSFPNAKIALVKRVDK